VKEKRADRAFTYADIVGLSSRRSSSGTGGRPTGWKDLLRPGCAEDHHPPVSNTYGLYALIDWPA
jgi:hypothetical protein